MVSILMYHGVTPVALPMFNWCQLPVQSFDQQMAILAQEYLVLPLKEVVDRVRAALPLPERGIVLTFDDGFRSVLTTAFPILQRYHFPATTFVVTSLPETGQPPWPDVLFHALSQSGRDVVVFAGRSFSLHSSLERQVAYRFIDYQLKCLDDRLKQSTLESLLEELGRPAPVARDSPHATLSWQEIERLHKTGLMTFGSHTHTHPILSSCPPERQEEELRVSRDRVREHLGSADHFAYPNGGEQDFTEGTKRLVQELGYACALTAIPGPLRKDNDPYALQRVPTGPKASASAGLGRRQGE